MKPVSQIILLLSATRLAASGLIPLGEHVDLRWRWESPAWTCHAVTDIGGEISRDPETVFLPLADKPYSAANPSISGARFTQPANPDFDFTGVPAGGPLWIAVQGTPGNGEAWPGFENNQSAVLGSYVPTDTRVSQTTARRWIRVSLVSYQPPHGKNARFSLWNTSSGNPPTVWMSTHDANVEDSYHFTEGTHNHLNWGFSAQGIHRIRLRASAFIGPGASNPTGWSETRTVTFAVGTFARWQAERFDSIQLDDPAICGPDADPDGDGLDNRLEYAFGTAPLAGGPMPLADGLGMPAFSLFEDGGLVHQTLVYPRRKAGPRLDPDVYQPMFSDSPDGPWSDNGVIITVAGFPSHQSSLDADWELVTARRPVPQGRTRGFARVAVSVGDGL